MRFLKFEYLSDVKWVELNWQLGLIPVRASKKMAMDTFKKITVGTTKKMAVSTMEKLCALEKMAMGTLEKMAVRKSKKMAMGTLELMLTQGFHVVDLHAPFWPPKSALSVGQSTTVPGKHCIKEKHIWHIRKALKRLQKKSILRSA